MTQKQNRYSDKELQEFRTVLKAKLQEAKKDLEVLENHFLGEPITEEDSPSFKLLEDGANVLSKQEIYHLIGRQDKFIKNLENALIRIENKTYGVCRVTGILISKERLMAVPHATLSIESKNNN